nr:hypothetical protein [uncultured Rhodoferax sp.]
MYPPDIGNPALSATHKRKFSEQSTETLAQRYSAIKALRVGLNTRHDLRPMVVSNAPALIKELRNAHHYCITTDLVALYDHEGCRHPRATRLHLQEKSDTNGGSREQ